MRTKVNIAQTTLAVLCIVSGIVFGGLGFLVPSPPTTHASVPAHVEMSAHAEG
jgi:hypothetical protein